jgi:hypothetical protein
MSRLPSSSIPLLMPVKVSLEVVTWTLRGRWTQLRHQSCIILEGLSKSSYDDLIWSRRALRSRRTSWFFPDRSRRDVAPGGSWALPWLMFRPIPRITNNTLPSRVLDSMRIPPSFRFSETRSFGHFSLTLTPVSSSRVCLVATAARNCNNGSFAVGVFGLRSIENHSPPFGESHFFRPLPLPLV